MTPPDPRCSVVLLPLANPLTTVALFLGLAGNMSSAERNRQ
ncbi:hypothetical protein ACVWC7_06695, partial [Escherichia coli]